LDLVREGRSGLRGANKGCGSSNKKIQEERLIEEPFDIGAEQVEDVLEIVGVDVVDDVSILKILQPILLWEKVSVSIETIQVGQHVWAGRNDYRAVLEERRLQYAIGNLNYRQRVAKLHGKFVQAIQQQNYSEITGENTVQDVLVNMTLKRGLDVTRCPVIA
jgi:hypothetical protein